jgi:predicted nuclease of predicted toxin-antitoxin system
VKILLDTCIWGGVIEALKVSGHDVIWAGAWDVDPGDDEILAHAHQEGRVLVTLKTLENLRSSETNRMLVLFAWLIGRLSNKLQSV